MIYFLDEAKILLSIAHTELVLLQPARIFDMMESATKAVFGRFNYDALNISAKKMKALEASAADIQALGRRSTQQAYDLGVQLEKASELVEPGTFEK